MHREAWSTAVYRVAKRHDFTTEQQQVRLNLIQLFIVEQGHQALRCEYCADINTFFRLGHFFCDSGR